MGRRSRTGPLADSGPALHAQPTACTLQIALARSPTRRRRDGGAAGRIGISLGNSVVPGAMRAIGSQFLSMDFRKLQSIQRDGDDLVLIVWNLQIGRTDRSFR